MRINLEELISSANDEIIARGNLSAVDEYFSSDYAAHGGGKDYKGHAFIRRFIGQLRSAISDIKIVKIKFMLQDGDTIVWQRRLSGIHTGSMMGIPPTNKKVRWIDMFVTRFEGSKIAEEWMVSELAGELLLNMKESVPDII